MSIQKPGIPVVQTQNRTMDLAFASIKENLELITGARPSIGKIQKLPVTATLDDVVAKVNEIVSRLNFDGN
jgi:hypothetical protein